MLSNFEWCFLFLFMMKKGFLSRHTVKSSFYGGSKRSLSKFTHEFFPQILWSWYKSMVFWDAVAFSFKVILPEIWYFFLVLGARSTLFKKTLCSEFFSNSYMCLNLHCSSKISYDDIFVIQYIYLYCLYNKLTKLKYLVKCSFLVPIWRGRGQIC